ncbi:uncharacterized protein MP3633_1769 [Marinomonas primoryensis]|uniref:Uncharacterized protein n=1 Tax=Marinomonas primoryensis TaxID=178399 RepID=A0A859CVG9_9GAMM|nr:uncharacterized protein MP3633_1769 [Marinomonas primoryensis]
MLVWGAALLENALKTFSKQNMNPEFSLKNDGRDVTNKTVDIASNQSS